MIIRIGYVAIALSLKKVTSSSTVTFKRYSGMDEREKINKLKQVTLSNMRDLETILKYNINNKIHFYRITSALIPLGTHPEVTNWNYRDIFKVELDYIGRLIKQHDIRVDLHADQFNVINSAKSEVVQSTIKNLTHLAHILDDMGLEDSKIIIHVGSSQGGKEKALRRFVENFKMFPEEVTNKIIIENDDKVFNIVDVLGLCKELNLPMVLDVHHYICNNKGEDLFEYLPEIFATWDEDKFIPKIHFSSPKEGTKDKRHADYIDSTDFIEFLKKAKTVVDRDFDVMLESKKKELALFELINEIQENSDFKIIDKTTIEV